MPINDDDVVQLAKLRNLEILDLSHTNITDASKCHLQGLPRIRAIGLSSTGMSDGVIRELEELARRHNMEAQCRVTPLGHSIEQVGRLCV